MKKSSAVPATFCAAVASMIVQGCSSPVSVRRCVDPVTGTILPDVACTSPVRATTFRGGRYARVPNGAGYTCIDTTTNLPVSDVLCRSVTGFSSGYYYGGHYYSRPGWGYDGTVSGGRISGYSTAPPSGADIHSSSGSVISRGGFGGGGSSAGG